MFKRISLVVILMFLIASFATTANASTKIQDEQDAELYPSSRIGQRAKEFIQAFNSGESGQIEAYLNEHMSPETFETQPLNQLVDAFSAIHQQVGELMVAEVQETGEFEVVIKAESRQANTWLDIAFSIQEEIPHHQGKLAFLPGRAPDANAYDRWEALSDLSVQLQKETNAPSIAMALVKDGKLAQSAVVGVRSLDRAEQTEINDAFHIGSVGKSMTATLIGRLIDGQKLRWDTTIGEVFEELDIKEAFRPVTIEQLLDHQGGVPPFVDDREFELESFVDKNLSPTEQRLKFALEAMSRDPAGDAGGGMIYSNAGYVILGAIAERVTEKSFENLMIEYVFEPLEMQSAGFGWPAKNSNGQGPVGHHSVDGKLKPQREGEIDVGYFLVPAGDMHLSVPDLAKFAAFHLNGLSGTSDLMSAETLQRLHRSPSGANYGGGWVISQAPDESPLHFHNGSLGTFYAAVFLYPKHDAAIVVAVNLANGVEAEVLKAVEAVFRRELMDDTSN